MKKFILSTLLIYLIIPIYVYAYSDYVIASGENIGIELKAEHVIIVGSYNINNYNVLLDSDLKIGDKIIKLEDYEITSSSNMQDTINKINKDNITVTYQRGSEELKTNIKLFKEDGEYKTGLYIRDTIRGVATLTYIDVENKTFGALGHEILEKTTKSKFDAKSGTIFESSVTGITKSSDGDPGEKNARSNSENIYGTVNENTKSGVFGTYTKDIANQKLYKVATADEVELGNAQILTVIEGNTVEPFDIKILKINKTSNTKNILFEVTDKTLLEKTGGIIQGMSGSPIIQNDNIVGAVNYVLVDKTNKGYGIFITNMLEESEN